MADTKNKPDLLDRLMSLFRSFADAYGTYDSAEVNESKGGKLEIKKTATTRRAPVTRELWEKHLSGEKSLGLIPIRENDTCLWGVIDIDSYDLDFQIILNQIEREKLPLVLCRSKSGGAHLFLFLSEPVSAEVVQSTLKSIAATLGYGTAEVFPKQRRMTTDRGDLGSWLNMPYFEGDATNRAAAKPGGMWMNLAEFVRHAESKRVPMKYLLETDFRRGSKKDPDFGDGPPCMQHLASQGFPEGTRNKGLFALATFAKKKYGSSWESHLERWNRDLFDPPLPSEEVVSIIKSQGKKDYNYTCREQPLSSHCNSTLCRTRKHGVGGDDDLPVISGMSVLDTDPPLWFVDVENDRLELTTEQLQNFRTFHRICMERLFRCYRMMKQDQWLTIVAESMKDAVRIEAPKEVGVGGHFYELVEAFLTDKHRGFEQGDLLLGRPYHNEEQGRYYFRLQDLMRYLELANFKDYTRGQVTTRIRQLGGNDKFFNVKGKGVNAWFLPDVFRPTPNLDLPPIDQEPI